ISFLNIYHLVHPDVVHSSKQNAKEYIDRLQNDARVRFAEQQTVLYRRKHTRYILHDNQGELPIHKIKDYSVSYIDGRDKAEEYSDPFYKDQWYLENYGQTGGKVGIDMNVVSVWKAGFTGKGIVVTVLDDGIDHSHPDLKKNYDPEASADLNDETDVLNDPMPYTHNSSRGHGTRCAGVIAAECNNNICGCGIAYNARIGGIRLIDGPVTGSMEAKALLYNNQHIDIISASWGPSDDGKTMEAPTKAVANALAKGVTEGRKGLGTIFVWATGNGGIEGDSCGADGFVGSIESISIGSVTDQGQKPYFMETCSSTMAVVPTGGARFIGEEGSWEKVKVVTTDINDGCIQNFQGTSSAAPLAAGCLALVLESNPKLTWRDVQHIVVRAAKIQSLDAVWTINGAGFHFSDVFGFGLMDCGKMVELAQNWTNMPLQHFCKTEPQHVDLTLDAGNCLSSTLEFDGCYHDQISRISSLEHVQAHVKIEAGIRGEIELYLTSPSGTKAQLLPRRDNDISDTGIDFVFMSVHTWGENPRGTWKLEVCYRKTGRSMDTVHDINTVLRNMQDRTVKMESGKIISWELRAYGYDDGKSHGEAQYGHIASETELQETMYKETQQSKRLHLMQGMENSSKDMGTTANINSQEHLKRYSESKMNTNLEDITEILHSREYSENEHVNTLDLFIGESPLHKPPNRPFFK
ncbi:hypothetical protein ACJMK2_029664, partial [Sinanodonta woodiana]